MDRGYMFWVTLYWSEDFKIMEVEALVETVTVLRTYRQTVRLRWDCDSNISILSILTLEGTTNCDKLPIGFFQGA